MLSTPTNANNTGGSGQDQQQQQQLHQPIRHDGSPLTANATAAASLDAKKILVCGSPRSGKSALVARYATGLSPDPFLSAYLQTLGAELVIKHVVEGENRLSLHLWSVGGHPRYRSTVTPLLTDDTAAVLVTVDLLSASSLEDAAVWVALAKEHCPTAIVYLIGTKADETDKITVSMPELAKVARDAGATAPLKTTSARTGAGVTDLFADLCLRLRGEFTS